MTIHLYGIPNCDSVRKARKWLEAEGRDHVFHDFKKEGVDPAKVKAWIATKGLDVVVNRRGTTFRKLSEGDKVASQDSHSAVALLVQRPSLIKRPVVEHEGGILIGFKENEWSQSLS
ncbi:MAG: arsenate reductase [Erythrobacter sp.]|uniref:arsenate reductase n=1 Tax=Erythrobacter sp. TaxID=1042 RepID=UPI0032F05139